MFGSKTVEEATIIGRGAVIEGVVRVRGRVQVDGRVEGTLDVEGTLSIGPEGKIIGEVIAEDIAVGGEIEGKVTARKHLHIVRSGRVRGELRYDTLQVDRGAVLDGRTLHGEGLPQAAVAPVHAARDSDAQERAEISAGGVPPAIPLKRASQAPAPMGAHGA